MRYRNGVKCVIGEASSGILRETTDEKQDFGIYRIIVFFDSIRCDYFCLCLLEAKNI